MQKHLSTAPKPLPKAVPKLGELGRRPAELKRGEGELFALLDRYLDKTIDTITKRKNCPEERDVLLPTMEEITMEVIGRPAADGRNQIKPALVKTYNDQAGEIKNWRTKWTDQAQLYEEKQQRMMQLRNIMVGQTPLLKLKQVPEKIGRGGTVGKIVKWLAAMRTWIEEEMDSTRGGEDIVIDRLTFAASVRIANPTNLVIAHSCDLCVAGHSTLIAAP